MHLADCPSVGPCDSVFNLSVQNPFDIPLKNPDCLMRILICHGLLQYCNPHTTGERLMPHIYRK